MRRAVDSQTRIVFVWQRRSILFQRWTTQRTLGAGEALLELNALLGADADVEWMFGFPHLGDEIRGFD